MIMGIFQQAFTEPQPLHAAIRLDESCDDISCQQARMQFGWSYGGVQAMVDPSATQCSEGGEMTGPLSLRVQGAVSLHGGACR